MDRVAPARLLYMALFEWSWPCPLPHPCLYHPLTDQCGAYAVHLIVADAPHTCSAALCFRLFGVCVLDVPFLQ